MFIDIPQYRKATEIAAAEIPVSGGAVLVTGADGLIGSCVVDVLIASNRLYGKNFSIYTMGRRVENLFERFGNVSDVRFVVQNVADPITIPGLNYIIHAASNADPRLYALQPVETILTNVLGAKSVIEYCRGKSARVLFTSSFEVYGKLEKEEYAENDFGVIDGNRIRSCYPESKRTAELLFRSAYDEFGVDCVIARLSSVYGPTMRKDDTKAHAQFLRNGLAGEKIVLKSKGTQKRTYSYVFDIVSGLFTVLFKGKAGEAYNIANDRSVATIAEVAQIIADLVGTEVTYDVPDVIEKKGFSQPQNCVLITDKIKSLDWSAKYDLKSGMQETLAILREYDLLAKKLEISQL